MSLFTWMFCYIVIPSITTRYFVTFSTYLNRCTILKFCNVFVLFYIYYSSEGLLMNCQASVSLHSTVHVKQARLKSSTKQHTRCLDRSYSCLKIPSYDMYHIQLHSSWSNLVLCDTNNSWNWVLICMLFVTYIEFL